MSDGGLQVDAEVYGGSGVGEVADPGAGWGAANFGTYKVTITGWGVANFTYYKDPLGAAAGHSRRRRQPVTGRCRRRRG